MDFYTFGQPSALPPDVLEKAKQDMDRALMPRTANGLLLGITISGPGALLEQVLYPVSRDPGRTLWFVEEFAYGRVPPDLYYAPGREVWINTPSGGYWKRVFDDSTLNLPSRERQLLTQALAPPQPSVPALDGFEPTAITPLRRVFALPQGMAIQNPDGATDLLSNFEVRATRRIITKVRGEPDSEEFELDVSILERSIGRLTVNAANLDSLVPIIVKRFPACHTNEDATKANLRIANAIRDQIPGLPTVTVIKTPGFIRLGDCWVYVHDGACFNGPVEFRTGCTIPCDPGISPQEALKAALGLLELEEKLSVMLPLLLLAHQGFLFNLFEAAGVTPKAPGFLNGETGSFKTSLAQAIFRPFEEQSQSPEASFRDTKAALEVKIGGACSRTLVVDDFQPPVTAAAGREMLEKLELIVRMFGDGIAKSRSNSELGRAKEFKPSGCCLITGEDTGGSHSSLLRCLLLPLKKGEISGERLRRYQEHPEWLRTHYFHFLEWAGPRGGEIVEFIRCSFQGKREFFAKAVSEPRQADIGAVLMLTADILLRYVQEVLVLADVVVKDIRYQWASILIEVLRRSEEETVEMNPVRMYLEALFDLCTTGKIQIAPGQAEFKAGYHTGFLKDGFWWLIPSAVYGKVTRFWQEQKVVFPLKSSKLHALLAQSCLIETSKERRDGKLKTLYSVKSSLDGRPRLLVLHTEQARAYLENAES